MIDNGSIIFESDIKKNLTGTFSFNIFKIQSNQYIPFLRYSDSSNVDQVNTTQVSIGLHYERGLNFYSTTFNRYRVVNEKPAFDLGITWGIKNLLGSQYGYVRSSFKISHYLKTNPIGYNKYYVEVGKIFGKLPWPLLYVFRGNETYGYNLNSFNLMNYYEFIANEYIVFGSEQHFQGFFLNFIPYLRKLKLREVVTFRLAMGSLSYGKDNNIIIPSYMMGLNRPYIEAGVGIENIFKFLRIDAIWRFSYLKNDNIEIFGIRACLQFIL